MDNHCDIKNVTLVIGTATSERGRLLNEQGNDKGVFQCDIQSLSESNQRAKAAHIGRIMFEHGIQQEICDSQAQYFALERTQKTQTPEEAYLWITGHIDHSIRMESSRISVLRTTEGIISFVDAMDSETISDKSGGREQASLDQRSTDRPKTQKQESRPEEAYLRAHQAWNPSETPHPYQNRQLGCENSWMD
jgi:hypothetical protein